MYLLVQQIKQGYINTMVNLLEEIKKLEKRIEELEEIINQKDKRV